MKMNDDKNILDQETAIITDVTQFSEKALEEITDAKGDEN